MSIYYIMFGYLILQKLDKLDKTKRKIRRAEAKPKSS